MQALASNRPCDLSGFSATSWYGQSDEDEDGDVECNITGAGLLQIAFGVQVWKHSVLEAIYLAYNELKKKRLLLQKKSKREEDVWETRGHLDVAGRTTDAVVAN